MMATRFKTIDRASPYLMPPSLQDWIPEDHIVHFILDAVNLFQLDSFHINRRGSGSEQYPPHMMCSLLIYCYATGRFSSREIESATYSDVAVRFIAANLHPDHDTICKFRRDNGVAFKKAFVSVLELASELGALKKVGGISVDGTKIKANASKHSAVSYEKAGDLIERLAGEVEQLMSKAENADAKPLEDGLSIPDEITHRNGRIDKLKQARQIIEERHAEEIKAKQQEYEEKKAKRDQQRQQGKKPKGKDPQPPSSMPPEKAQVNFTDEESRIMKSSSGFEQSYNVQAAVDTEGSMLILGTYVTNEGNDKQQLKPALESVDPELRNVTELMADSGYFSEQAVEEIQQDTSRNTEVYCAVERTPHGRTVKDLEQKDCESQDDEKMSTKDKMKLKLKTKKGRECYKLRKQTVEPVFGIAKSALRFRQFLLRGLDKVNIEWDLVALAYNLKRLHKMTLDNPVPSFDKKFFIGA